MKPYLMLLLAMAGCSPPMEATIAVTHVDLLTMDSPTLLRDHAVLVNQDRIVWIGPTEDAPLSGSMRVVDGQGRVLLPGLADMHVHIDREDMPLFLANGTTTIREMNGSEEHLTMRDDIRAGDLLGPTLHVTGTLIAGQEIGWRHVVAETPEEAVRIVSEQAAAGYESIKAYEGLSVETYEALVAEAARHHLPVVGHIPEAVGLDGALARSQRGIEHVEQIMYRIADGYDDLSVIPPAVQAIKANGTWVTPTLSVMEVLGTRRSPWFLSLYDRPEMAFTPPGLRGWWESMRPEPEIVSEEWKPLMPEVRFLSALVEALHEAGVPMLTGTDTPNPMMVPGFSIHDELDALVRAGMPAYDVLLTATARPAEFLGQVGEFGTLTVGARADMILVEGSPLVDLSTLKTPEAVMVRGTWLDRSELDRLLDETRRLRAD